MAGVFCWFSILLMIYYDARLALIAILSSPCCAGC